ncbi:hypothetical protein KA005_10860, partial [bacterium]|nr:hypothetical protein [bacterium]
FKAVDKKAVAKADIRLAYDPDTGFFGSSVKSQGFQMTVTEYERVLTISSNGSYRIMAPPEKIWLPGKLLYCRVFDQAKGCNVTLVYRDRNQNAWGKKVRIRKFITDKVYELCKDSLAGIEYFSTGKTTAVIKMQFVPFPRQKIKEAFYDLSKLIVCGINARGTHLHTKKVAKIKVQPVSKNKSQKHP